VAVSALRVHKPDGTPVLILLEPAAPSPLRGWSLRPHVIRGSFVVGVSGDAEARHAAATARCKKRAKESK
jgi:hypothetical protein